MAGKNVSDEVLNDILRRIWKGFDDKSLDESIIDCVHEHGIGKVIVSKEFNEVWGLEEEHVLFELDGWKYYFTAYEETTIETLRGFKRYKLDRIDRTARIYRKEIDGSEQDVQ